jgi:hypothetical protein
MTTGGQATNLARTLARNTRGFGHAINDGRRFWIGDFNGDGRDNLLFYYPGYWWLGSITGPQLPFSCSLVGNTRPAARK